MSQQSATVPCQYRTGRTLGTGTYGIVKEAVHIETGQHYACKMISKKRMLGRKNMVYNEIDALKRVSAGHPNIVTLHDYFETTRNLYFCFDLCAGGALFDGVWRRGRYSESEAAELVRTIFEAVKHIHDCGIVHRDLKPENLLFRSELEKPAEIMVADFGLSYALPDDEFDLPIDICGTPGYMAPEILERTGHGMPVDIWAMGVVTYFLLSGCLPFDRDTRQQETEAVIAGDYHFEPRQYWTNVSETARNFVSACLTVDPEIRPTADEMLQHPWLAAKVPPVPEVSSSRKTSSLLFSEGVYLPCGTAASSGSRHHDHDHDHDPRQRAGEAGPHSTTGSSRSRATEEASPCGKRSHRSATRTPLLEGRPGSALSSLGSLRLICLPLPSLR